MTRLNMGALPGQGSLCPAPPRVFSAAFKVDILQIPPK